MPRKAPPALDVRLAFGPRAVLDVGRVGTTRGTGLLEYGAEFVRSGLGLNPLVPPSATIVRGSPRVFRGLPGVLGDSLPDAWGEELLRRYAARHGLPYGEFTNLDRLALVGSAGPGALTYEPARMMGPADVAASGLDLDAVARATLAVVEGREVANVDDLLALAGSSGGARPKISVAFDPSTGAVRGSRLAAPGEEMWLVKFRGADDPLDSGPLEAAYADMARDAGIEVAPTRLLPAKRGAGYFATRRFDRHPDGTRPHMLSVAAMLDVDWSEPSIEYAQLLALANKVAGHDAVEQMFRRMVFNVAAHNRDDHTKQHAFLMDVTGRWRLAPAYDLTYSGGPGGEHYLGVDGAGASIERRNVANVAKRAGVPERRAAAIVEEVRAAVARFPDHAERYGVSARSRGSLRALPLL